MIDIHTHVLPGVDDGAGYLDESLEMLSLAEDSGVKVLVTTPHCNIPGEFDNYVSPDLDKLWHHVRDRAKEAGIGVKLCRGMEIFATEELPELLSEKRVWTLNGTDYFLTEFDFGEDPDFCRYILRRCRDRGFRPVIAHPERYFFVQENPEIAYEWCRAGYGLQVNKGSLLGKFGRQTEATAHLLMEHGLAACVASDAHTSRMRSTHMGEIKEFLTEEYGADYTRLLLVENPLRIITGKELLGYEPIPFD
jgi:protein-tyrosine phosphatase